MRTGRCRVIPGTLKQLISATHQCRQGLRLHEVEAHICETPDSGWAPTDTPWLVCQTERYKLCVCLGRCDCGLRVSACSCFHQRSRACRGRLSHSYGIGPGVRLSTSTLLPTTAACAALAALGLGVMHAATYVACVQVRWSVHVTYHTP